jgi:hypothetical protein
MKHTSTFIVIVLAAFTASLLAVGCVGVEEPGPEPAVGVENPQTSTEKPADSSEQSEMTGEVSQDIITCPGGVCRIYIEGVGFTVCC